MNCSQKFEWQSQMLTNILSKGSQNTLLKTIFALGTQMFTSVVTMSQRKPKIHHHKLCFMRNPGRSTASVIQQWLTIPLPKPPGTSN